MVDKKQIFKTAWEIARAAQKKFGGHVREYFSESLKQAWGAIKNKKAPFLNPIEPGFQDYKARFTEILDAAYNGNVGAIENVKNQAGERLYKKEGSPEHAMRQIFMGLHCHLRNGADLDHAAMKKYFSIVEN